MKAKAAGVDSSLRLNNIGIIMDDCMFDKSATKGADMRWVFMNGRHDNIFFINTVQYLMDLQVELRENIDIVIAFPVSGSKMVGKMRENLLTCFDTDEDLVDAFSMLRENEALVFDKKAFNQKRPYLFFYKAERHLPPFRVGSDEFWKLYYAHFERRQLHEASKRIMNRVQSARASDSSTGGAGGAPAASAPMPASGGRVSKFVRVENSAKAPPAPKAPRAPRAPRAASVPAALLTY